MHAPSAWESYFLFSNDSRDARRNFIFVNAGLAACGTLVTYRHPVGCPEPPRTSSQSLNGCDSVKTRMGGVTFKKQPCISSIQ